MGLIFTAKNIHHGTNTNFYFSEEDFIARTVDNSLNGGRDVLLTIGKRFEDWFEVTEELAQVLYTQVIGGLVGVFESSLKSKISNRQVEILIGNQTLRFCRRFSRAAAQLELLGNASAWKFLSVKEQPPLPTGLPTSSLDAEHLIYSNEWGELIELAVLELFFGLGTTRTLVLKEEISQNVAPISRNQRSSLFGIKTKIYLIVQKLLAPLAAKNWLSISGSFLGRVNEILLFILLLQIPMLTEVRPTRQFSLEPKTRSIKITANDRSEIAIGLMKGLIPTLLLEKFDQTASDSITLGFPLNPSVVFTSGSYMKDDYFKAHLAKNISTTKYIVGQHGGNFGVKKTSYAPPEMNASDLFLSWGWKHDNHRVKEFGRLKPILKVKSKELSDSLEVFLRCDFIGETYSDVTPDTSYYDGVLAFCAELNRLGLITSLRIHASTSPQRLKQLSEAVQGFEHVQILDANAPFRKIVAKGQRIIFSYDSTGMLEMASAGLPFFSFIPDGLGLIRPEFARNYDALRRVGLLSEDPVEAARLVKQWVNKTDSSQIYTRKALSDFSLGLVTNRRRKLLDLAKLLSRFRYRPLELSTRPAKIQKL